MDSTQERARDEQAGEDTTGHAYEGAGGAMPCPAWCPAKKGPTCWGGAAFCGNAGRRLWTVNGWLPKRSR